MGRDIISCKQQRRASDTQHFEWTSFLFSCCQIVSVVFLPWEGRDVILHSDSGWWSHGSQAHMSQSVASPGATGQCHTQTLHSDVSRGTRGSLLTTTGRCQLAMMGDYDSLWADRRSVAGSQLGHLCPGWRAESDWHRVTETRACARLRVSCLARAAWVRVASDGHPQLRSSRPGDNWDMYRRNKITRAPHQGSGDTGPGLYDGDCSEARTHCGLCIVYMQFVLDYAILRDDSSQPSWQCSVWYRAQSGDHRNGHAVIRGQT